MSGDINLEANILNNFLGKKISAFLMGGLRLHGVIHDFNDSVIIFEEQNSDDKMIVYKSAIASIVFNG